MTMPGGWEWLILVGVILLLFGAKRLPEMARSVGQSARVFRGEMKGLKSDDETARKSTEQPAEPPAAQPAPPSALPQAQQAPVQQAPAQQAKQESAAETPRVSQPGPNTTGQ
jgi:sec-independent protein translocase protein TatA